MASKCLTKQVGFWDGVHTPYHRITGSRVFATFIGGESLTTIEMKKY